MRQRGATLIEMLVGVLVASVAAAGIYTFFLSLNSAQTFSVAMPNAQQHAYQMASTIAGSVRRATLCTSTDSGCIINSGLQDPSATAITLYYRNGNDLQPITYDVTGGAFRKTVGNTTTVIYDSGASLALTYYKGGAYHSQTLVPFVPDSTTAPYVVGVKIDATITSGGATATYSTVIRLRNGPKKVSPVE